MVRLSPYPRPRDGRWRSQPRGKEWASEGVAHDRGDTTNLPIITLKSNVPVTNSRDVAAFFGKRHTNILRAIDEMECSPEFTQLNFEPSTYTDATGRSLRSIDMTKDGFVFLVMGFTGRKAAAFKEAYIARFNEMEGELRTGRADKCSDCTDGDRCSRAARTVLTGAVALHLNYPPPPALPQG